jgi:YD repeat-containing protein
MISPLKMRCRALKRSLQSRQLLTLQLSGNRIRFEKLNFMKITPTAWILMVFCICLFACKKSNTVASPPQLSTKPVRIASSGTNYTSTVFLISYNTAGNIASIDDSVAGIIYTATYDASGNLVHISQMQGSTAGDSATYTYNAQGEMTGSKTSIQGTGELTTYYYTAGQLTADSTYYFVGGIPNSLSFSAFVWSGGNISAVRPAVPEAQTVIPLI